MIKATLTKYLGIAVLGLFMLALSALYQSLF